MTAKSKSAAKGRRSGTQAKAQGGNGSDSPRARQHRSDEDKVRLVRQILASGNQSAEIKKLGIYPNQFYDWKKKYAAELGGLVGVSSRQRRSLPGLAARTVADEAKAFIEGKASLLDRLRAQREELDQLISELSG